MCQKMKNKGEFFIKISNMGNPEFSVGYDCIHEKTIELLFTNVVNTITYFFFKKTPIKARAYLTCLLIESFKDKEEALTIGKEILNTIGGSKEVFRGQKSVLTEIKEE